jgi:hypothetical protein
MNVSVNAPMNSATVTRSVSMLTAANVSRRPDGPAP